MHELWLCFYKPYCEKIPNKPSNDIPDKYVDRIQSDSNRYCGYECNGIDNRVCSYSLQYPPASLPKLGTSPTYWSRQHQLANQLQWWSWCFPLSFSHHITPNSFLTTLARSTDAYSSISHQKKVKEIVAENC